MNASTPYIEMLNALERMNDSTWPSPDSLDYVYAAQDILGVDLERDCGNGFSDINELADEIFEADCECSLEAEPFASMVLHLVAQAAA